MSRLVTSLCQPPAFGSFGSPTFIGGPSGLSDAGSAIDVTSLPGRSTLAPGTVFPATKPGVKSAWASLATTGVVWFDGFTALYGLAKHAPAANWSLSYWMNLYDEAFLVQQTGSQYACIFGSTGAYEPAGRGFFVNMECTYTYNNTGAPRRVAIGLDEIGSNDGISGYPTDVGWGLVYPDDLGGVSSSPIDLDQGWKHVMVSVNAAGTTQPHVRIYVNDTAIFDGLVNSTNFGPTPPGGRYADSWLFPWNISDNLDSTTNGWDGASILAPWTVGGFSQWSSDDAAARPMSLAQTLPDRYSLINPFQGYGLVSALTEVYVNIGTAIDWSSSGNRNKFHQADALSLSYAPVDIGKNGATPTGAKPTMYFTGGPNQFYINRATGRTAAVWHNTIEASLPGGVVGKIQPYHNLPGS